MLVIKCSGNIQKWNYEVKPHVGPMELDGRESLQNTLGSFLLMMWRPKDFQRQRSMF